MLRFEGDRDFNLPPGQVHAKLGDARFLVECIPDVESVSVNEADRAELIIRPGFSFVRGTLEVTLSVVDRPTPTEPSGNGSTRVLLSSRGIGSSSEVEATLAVSEQGAGTRVHWVAEVKSLGGLLKLVPSGLIRGAAEK